MPLFKAYCSKRRRKESSLRAKVRPCRSVSPNPGCELFCSTHTCRRTILCHSGTRCPRLTRRRLGWLGRFDSASPQRLIPSCREPPRHFLACRHFQTLVQPDTSGTRATSLTKRAWAFMLYLFVQQSAVPIGLLTVCCDTIDNAMKLRWLWIPVGSEGKPVLAIHLLCLRCSSTRSNQLLGKMTL